ncbi:MAG: hypothetical protein AAB227_01895, partial [Pseudomonadota bacterium]
MTAAKTLADHRELIRANTLADETDRVKALLSEAEISAGMRQAAQTKAAAFVRDARAETSRSSLVDKFLQEYGLS